MKQAYVLCPCARIASWSLLPCVACYVRLAFRVIVEPFGFSRCASKCVCVRVCSENVLVRLRNTVDVQVPLLNQWLLWRPGNELASARKQTLVDGDALRKGSRMSGC